MKTSANQINNHNLKEMNLTGIESGVQLSKPLATAAESKPEKIASTLSASEISFLKVLIGSGQKND